MDIVSDDEDIDSYDYDLGYDHDNVLDSCTTECRET